MAQIRSSARRSGSKAWYTELLLVFTDIIYRIGISGFIVVFVCGFILAYATEDQKEAIIDKYVLFNSNVPAQSFAIGLMVISITVYVIEAYFFMKYRRLDKQEIDRLLVFKKLYQEQELGRVPKSKKTI